jgi:hypothetical protein
LDSLIPTFETTFGNLFGYAIDVQQISGREYQRIGNFDVDVIKFTSKVKVPQMAGITFTS